MNRLTLIILAILAGLNIYQYVDGIFTKDKLEKVEGYESLYHVAQKKDSIWQDKEKQWRIKSGSADVSNKTLKDAAKEGDPRVNEILKEFKAIKKDFSNLVAYSNFQTESISELKGLLVKDTTKEVINGKDTLRIKVEEIEADTEFSSYKITIFPPDSITGKKKADVIRHGRESFSQVVYTERLTKKGKKIFWPFGKINYSSELVSKNPETKVVSLESLTVKRKK
jgi:hypothetical protein